MWIKLLFQGFHFYINFNLSNNVAMYPQGGILERTTQLSQLVLIIMPHLTQATRKQTSKQKEHLYHTFLLLLLIIYFLILLVFLCAFTTYSINNMSNCFFYSHFFKIAFVFNKSSSHTNVWHYLKYGFKLWGSICMRFRLCKWNLILKYQ